MLTWPKSFTDPFCVQVLAWALYRLLSSFARSSKNWPTTTVTRPSEIASACAYRQYPELLVSWLMPSHAISQNPWTPMSEDMHRTTTQGENGKHENRWFIVFHATITRVVTIAHIGWDLFLLSISSAGEGFQLKMWCTTLPSCWFVLLSPGQSLE